MEDDTGVRELVELIFGKKPTIPEKIFAHSSISSNVLTKDFSKKLKDVLRLRKHIVQYRWARYFDISSREMLSSHQKYLSHLMYICLYEHKCNRNIFDSFISVCALVINLGNETLAKTGMDFHDLNPDIIIVFYRNVWKSSFPKQGGSYGFVEYICGHNYLECNWDENDLALYNDDITSVNFKQDLHKSLVKEFDSYRPSEEISPAISTEMYEKIMCITGEVLSTTSVELPTLLSEYELVKRLVESRKREIANKSEQIRRVEFTSTFETSHGNSSSNSDSKPNCFVAQQEDISWHENIVQAVIKHNHSNISRHENVNNQKLVEAEKTLEHLKTSIKSLIEVLDECNKE